MTASAPAPKVGLLTQTLADQEYLCALIDWLIENEGIEHRLYLEFLQMMLDAADLAAEQVQDTRIRLLEEAPELDASQVLIDALLTVAISVALPGVGSVIRPFLVRLAARAGPSLGPVLNALAESSAVGAGVGKVVEGAATGALSDRRVPAYEPRSAEFKGSDTEAVRLRDGAQRYFSRCRISSTVAHEEALRELRRLWVKAARGMLSKAELDALERLGERYHPSSVFSPMPERPQAGEDSDGSSEGSVSSGSAGGIAMDQDKQVAKALEALKGSQAVKSTQVSAPAPRPGLATLADERDDLKRRLILEFELTIWVLTYSLDSLVPKPTTIPSFTIMDTSLGENTSRLEGLPEYLVHRFLISFAPDTQSRPADRVLRWGYPDKLPPETVAMSVPDLIAMGKRYSLLSDEYANHELMARMRALLAARADELRGAGLGVGVRQIAAQAAAQSVHPPMAPPHDPASGLK